MVKIAVGYSASKVLQEAESKRRFSGDFIPYFWLAGHNDIARIRIVSSHEADQAEKLGVPSVMVTAPFHRHQMTSRSGVRYYTNTMCLKDIDADGILHGECNLCDQEEPVARYDQFMLWVWVYYLLHPNADEAKKWEEVQVGQQIMYQETLNKFMIWQDGFRARQSLEARLDRNGSLTDRDYERTRFGAKGGQVSYEFLPLEPTAMPAHILEAAQALPSLIDVAEKKVRTMDGKPDPDAAERESGSHTEVRRGATPTPVAPVETASKDHVASASIYNVDEGINLDEMPF